MSSKRVRHSWPFSTGDNGDRMLYSTLFRGSGFRLQYNQPHTRVQPIPTTKPSALNRMKMGTSALMKGICARITLPGPFGLGKPPFAGNPPFAELSLLSGIIMTDIVDTLRMLPSTADLCGDHHIIIAAALYQHGALCMHAPTS